jgi:hypothetical protein
MARGSTLDMNTNTLRNRIDVFVSPQAAAILKPVEALSIYYAYMVSYLPASGDQFSALTDGFSRHKNSSTMKSASNGKHSRISCIRSPSTTSNAPTFRCPTPTDPDFSSCRAATQFVGSRRN